MKIAMLFPGYGSQYVGMAKELYDDSRLIQEYFEEASNCLNINFVKLCFASSDSELAKLDNAYESIFIISSSIAALLVQRGIKFTAVAGFDTGELSALCATGGLSFPDGLYFLSKYAQAYQELLKQSNARMIAIEHISTDDLDHACAKIAQNHVWRAASLWHDTHRVSGDSLAVGSLEVALLEQGGIIRDIPVESGLHCPFMDPILVSLQDYIEKIDFKDISIPLYMGLDGLPVLEGNLIKERILKSINSPIYWNTVLQNLASFDCLIEVGPGSMLSLLIAKIYPEKKIITVNKLSDIDVVEKACAPSHQEISHEEYETDA